MHKKTIWIFFGMLAWHCERPAYAWGPQGHEIVAEIAARELTPSAREEVARLLGGSANKTMRAVSSWSDRIRELPEHRHTGPLHYVNLPRDTCRYVEARDCPSGNCAVAAIDDFALELRTSASKQERRDALKWLIHLVGDIHQPLHAGYRDDKGGNTVQVRFEGKGSNLHALLDSGLIARQKLGVAEHADKLAGEASNVAGARWYAGAAQRWAEESCELVPGVYPEKRKIDEAYISAITPMLEKRLALAGHRLAGLLNTLFAQRGRKRR